MKTWLLACLICACATHAPPPPRATSDYAIELRRPSHAGDRAHVVTTATFDDTRTTYTEQVVVKKEERHHRLRFDAMQQVLEVDPLGNVILERRGA